VIIVVAMTAKLTGALREAPTTVPALAAVALFVIWATDQAGFPVTHWAPGGLVLLALLAIALGLVRIRLADMPTSVRIALAAMVGYTALSYLSILWAGVQGDAWEGANRTLLYLLVFALFASWRQRGAGAALLLIVWSLALSGLAAFTLLHLDAAGAAPLQELVPGGRLVYPTGYANANAAQWLMAFWPALLLARSDRLPAALRGLLAGGAVLLADVALLSLSRGSLYATPVMVVLVFALLPGRLRTFALMVLVAGGIALAVPALLKVGDHEHATPTLIHGAVLWGFLGALLVGALAALGAWLETRPSLSGGTRRRATRTVVKVVALAALVAALGGGLAVAGNPLTRLEHGWNSFKGGYGADATSGNRLLSGLGSNRYDFYRVALDELLAHPLLGVGADNFQEQYLRHGRSEETPRYPHSVELRTISQTGLLGTLLALLGLGAALLASARAIRSSDPLARAVAAAALAGFGYWVVHGSFDWFWEFPGLGAPAFAMLGLACALAPARGRAPRPDPAGTETSGRSPAPGIRRLGIVTTAALAALLLAATLAAPWLSQLEIQSAAKVWRRSPQAAYGRLKDAARLNPLSDQAYLVAGSIALRYRDLARADREFGRALARTPGDAYATLERGAIASARSQRSKAIELLERSVQLDPRDALARQALELTRRGGRVNLDQLNRSILREADQLA
jgi:tetratricopeptide (TPR) repeat protein